MHAPAVHSCNGLVVAPSAAIRSQSQGGNIVQGGHSGRTVVATSGGSLHLPVRYAGSSASANPTEAVVRQTSAQGGASELGAPALTQAAPRPATRPMGGPMCSPAPSVATKSPAVGARQFTPQNRPPMNSQAIGRKSLPPGGQEPVRLESVAEPMPTDRLGASAIYWPTTHGEPRHESAAEPTQMDRLISTLKAYDETVQKQLSPEAILSKCVNTMDVPKQDSADATVPKSVATMDATAAAAPAGSSKPSSLATLAGVIDSAHEARIEARFADIERCVEKRFAELERRCSNQEGALIEVVAQMRRLVLDTDKRLNSLESGSKEHVQQESAKRISNLDMLSNVDNKLHDSKIGTLPGTPDSTTRSLIGGKSDISQSNVSQSNISTDIHWQVRSLQMKFEVLQYEIKIDAGQVRRLHARIDLLETDINEINDREKWQVVTEGTGEKKSGVEDTNSSSAQTKTSSVPWRGIMERVTKVENEQKGLTDAMWQLREVVEAFDWKIEQFVSLVRTDDSSHQARIKKLRSG